MQSDILENKGNAAQIETGCMRVRRQLQPFHGGNRGSNPLGDAIDSMTYALKAPRKKVPGNFRVSPAPLPESRTTPQAPRSAEGVSSPPPLQGRPGPHHGAPHRRPASAARTGAHPAPQRRPPGRCCRHSVVQRAAPCRAAQVAGAVAGSAVPADAWEAFKRTSEGL